MDVNGTTISPLMERFWLSLTPEERNNIPSDIWSLSVKEESTSDSLDGEVDDDLGDVEDTTIYPETTSSAQMEFAPPADGNPYIVTLPPRNESPNLHSFTEAEDSTQDAIESLANKDPVNHESLSAGESTVENRDPTARKHTMLERGARTKKQYTPSPLSRPPMIADADDTEPVYTETEVKSTQQQSVTSYEGTYASQPGKGSSDQDASNQPENSHDDIVEQRPKSLKKHPEIAEIEDDSTVVDSIEGDAIPYAVPFRDQTPPSAQSYGKGASKLVKGFLGKGKGDGHSTEDEPLPPCDGEVSEGPKQTSDESRKTRKRSASSTSSQASKRSRLSPYSVKVSGRRLPLLFTLATPSSGVEHRHVVIPLPVSWPTFLRIAVRAFARDPCGQETPTEISNQAKYVMKWSKPVTYAHGSIFPGETELCGENINAVLQWMLYSGSYDFCQIHDTQTVERIVKDEAKPIMSENRPRRRKVDGNKTVYGTIALGSKGNHETACNVPNNGPGCEDQGQQDIESADEEELIWFGRTDSLS